MGFLSEHRYRAALPWADDEDALETGEVGNLGNVRETTALQVVVKEVEVARGSRIRREGRACYGEEVPVEFGAWERHLDRSCSAAGMRGAATSATPSTWTSKQATAW